MAFHFYTALGAAAQQSCRPGKAVQHDPPISSIMRALASRLALLLPAFTFAQTQPDANCDNVPEQCVAGITGRLGSISDCGTNGPMGYECCS